MKLYQNAQYIMRRMCVKAIYIDISGCIIQIKGHSTEIIRTTVKEMEQYQYDPICQ